LDNPARRPLVGLARRDQPSLPSPTTGRRRDVMILVRTWRFPVLLALVLGLLVTPAAGLARQASPAPPAAHPPLRIVTSFQIDNLDPVEEGFWLVEFGAAELPLRLAADGGGVEPWLLQGYEPLDDLRWRLRLRPDLAFQNGKPLDAGAFAAVLQRQIERSPSVQAELPGATAEVTGEREVTLTTSRPTPAVPALLATEDIFPVYDVAAVEAVGDDFAALAGTGFYTGPYAVAALSDQELRLERHAGYWGGPPPLEGVSVRFVPDAQARILAVQNGEADLALYAPTEVARTLEGRDDAFFVAGETSRGGPRAFLNLRAAPLDDRRVRRALLLGIDYRELAEDVMDGAYLQASGLYPPAFPWAVTNQTTDQARAAALLDEAGWGLAESGFREKDGEPLRLVFLIYPQQPDLVPLTTAVQAQLAALGIEAEIRRVEDNYAAMQDPATEWHVGLSFEGAVSFGGSPDPILRQYLLSDGESNFGGVAVPELDALIEELIVTSAEPRRTELLTRIQEIVIEEEALQFFLAFSRPRVVVGPAYRGYLPRPGNLWVTLDTKPSA